MSNVVQHYENIRQVVNIDGGTLVLANRAKLPHALVRRTLRVDRSSQRETLGQWLIAHPDYTRPIITTCFATTQDLPDHLLSALAEYVETDRPEWKPPRPFRPTLPAACMPWSQQAGEAHLWHSVKTALGLPSQTQPMKILEHIGSLDHSVCVGLLVDLENWSEKRGDILAAWLAQLEEIKLMPNVILFILIVFDHSGFNITQANQTITDLFFRRKVTNNIVILPTATPVEIGEVRSWKAEIFSDRDLQVDLFSLLDLEVRLFPADEPQRMANIWGMLLQALGAAWQY